jgi:glucose-6-phosphate isomerase
MSMEKMVSTLVDFDLTTGLSKTKKPLQRYLTHIKGLFYDTAALEAQLAQGNPLIYEFFDMGVPDSEKETVGA